MTGLPNERGKAVDELIANPRRLLVAHVCLGIVSAIGLWLRPGTFTPHLLGRVGMGGSPSVLIVVDTAIAWLPYVVGMLVARKLLSDRGGKAVYVYIALAGIVAAVSISLYLDVFHMATVLPPILISIGAALALLAIVVMCGSLWPRDTRMSGG
jgi:hypothetical protein